MPNPIVIPPGENGPREMTDEEVQEQVEQQQRYESRQLWMTYSTIAMQVVKMQGDQFATPQDIASKAGKIADAMLIEFQQRFHG